MDVQPPPDTPSSSLPPPQPAQRETPSAAPQIGAQHFAHLFLDGRIGDTYLEAVNSADFPPLFLHYLKEFAPKQTELISLIEQFQENFPGDPQVDDCTRVHTFLKALRPTERLLLPAGWKKGRSGHMMLCLIEAKRNNCYDVTLFNSGGGLASYHPTQIDGYKAKACPWITFKKVPRSLLLPNEGPGWINALFHPQIYTQSEAYHAKALYEGVFGEMWEYRAIQDSSVEYTTMQRDGVCASKIWGMLCRFEMGLEAYKRFHFEMRSAALSQVMEDNPDFPPRMLREAAEVFAKEVEKKAGSLILVETAEKALTLIQQVREKYPLRMPKKTGWHTPLEVSATINSLGVYEVGQLPELEDESPEVRRIALEGFLPYHAVPNSKELNTQLKELIESVENFIQTRGTERIAPEMVWSFVSQLPLDATFWDGVEEKEACIDQMSTLLYLYQQHYLKGKGKAPHELLMAATVHVTVFELAARLLPKPFKDLKPKNHFLDLRNEALFFELLDPDCCERMEALSSYFERKSGAPFDMVETEMKPALEMSAEISFYRELLYTDCELATRIQNRAKTRGISHSLSEENQAVALLAGGQLYDFGKEILWFQRFLWVSEQMTCWFGYRRFSSTRDLSRRTSAHGTFRNVVKVDTQFQTHTRLPPLGAELWPPIEQNLWLTIHEDRNLFQKKSSEPPPYEGTSLQLHPAREGNSDEEKIVAQLSWSGSETALQPLTLFETFEKHPHLFKEEKVCTLFWLQLFKTDHLRPPLPSLFSQSRVLVIAATNFLRTGLHHTVELRGKERDMVGAALFYIRLTTELASSILPLKESDEKEAYCALLEQCEKHLTTLENTYTSDQEYEALVHQHRLHFELMREERLPERASSVEIFAAWFAMGATAPPPNRRMRSLEKIVTKRLYAQIEAGEFDRVDPQSLAKKTLARIGLPRRLEEGIEWEREGLLLRGGRWQFDCASGYIFQDGMRIGRYFPRIDKMQTDYRRLFGDADFLFFSEGGTRSCTFDHPIQGELTILDYYSLREGIELTIKGEKWRYLPPDQLPQSDIPTTLIANHLHWRTPRGIVITTQEDWHTPIAEIFEDKLLVRGEMVVVLGAKKGRLTAIDHPECHEVNIDKERKEIDSITFPRCYSMQGRPLSFVLRKKRLLWSDDERFALCKSESGSAYLSIPNHIVIQREESGEEKLIVPALPLDRNSTQPFSEEGALKIPDTLDNTLIDHQEHYPFFVFGIEGGEMRAQSVEQHLYLAYLRLHERAYDAAFEHLCTLSSLDMLSPLSTKIIGWIRAYPFDYSHRSPSALALALKAASIEMADSYAKKLRTSSGSVEELYRCYLDRISGVPQRFLLSKEEEWHLLRGVSLENALFAMRASLLDETRTAPQNGMRTTSMSIALLDAKKDDFPFYRGEHHVDTTLFDVPRNHYTVSSFFWSAWHFATGSKEEKAHIMPLLHMVRATRQATCNPSAVVAGLSAEALALLIVVAHSTYNRRTFPDTSLLGKRKKEEDCLLWEKGMRSKYKADDIRDKWWKEVEPTLNLKEVDGCTAAPLTYKHSKPPSLPPKQMAEVSGITTPILQEMATYLTAIPKERPTAAPLAWKKACFFPEEYRSCVEKEKKVIEDEYRKGTTLLAQREGQTLPKESVDLFLDTGKEHQAALCKQIEELEEGILTRANRLPEKREERLHRQLDLESGKAFVYTLPLLEECFLIGEVAPFQKGNPALTDADVTWLMEKMGEWEALQVSSLHLAHALKYGEKVKLCDQKPATADLEVQRMLDCAKIAQALAVDFSHLDEEERRLYLVFNRHTGRHPRLDQREDVNKLHNEMCILMRIMGAGKTAVLAPLWGKRVANQGSLPILFVDRSQFATVSEVLKTSQKSCFNQEVFTFDYHREALTLTRLEWIHNELKEKMKMGALLILCPEMLQLFDLERCVALRRLENCRDEETAPLQERLQMLNQILHIFKQKGVGLGDEIDLLLRSDKELTLPEGEIERLTPQKVALMRVVIETLCSEEIKIDGRPLKEFVRLEEKEQTHLTLDEWKAIRPEVGLYLAQRSLELKLSEQKALHADFLQFIEGKPIDTGGAFWRYVERMHTSFDPTDNEAAELICLMKHLFQDRGLLQTTFRQVGGRQFGRARDPQRPGKVIPYLAANTPGQTEFAYPYQAVLAQLVDAVHEGVEEGEVLYVAQELEGLALAQMQQCEIPFEETAEAELFFDITGIDLREIDKGENLQKATEKINASLENRLTFEMESAHLYSTFYPRRITSSAQSLPNLLHSLSGMSGTPWNSAGYAPDLADHVHSDAGRRGEILNCMHARKEETAVHTFDPRAFSIALNGLYDANKNRFPDALIDAAALFNKNGFNNDAVAKEILSILHQNNSLQRAVLYFSRPSGGSESNQFTAMMMKEGAYVKIPLADTSASTIQKAGLDSPDDYVVFFPEKQTTGSDIPLSPHARGVLTFDETMTLRTLLQAMMRMRSYLDRQRVDFALSPVLREKIPKGLSPIAYMIEQAVINEAREKADSQYRSYKQMLDEVFFEQFRAHIESWNEKTQTQEMVALSTLYAPLLFRKNLDALFDKLFGNEESVDSVETLKLYAQALKTRFTERLKSAPRSLEKDLETITKKINAVLTRAQERSAGFVTHLSMIREKAGLSSSEHQEMVQEGQVEQQTEQHVDLQVEEALLRDLEELRKSSPDKLRAETEWYAEEGALEGVIEKMRAGKTIDYSVEESFTKPTTPINERYSRFGRIWESPISMTENFLKTTHTLLPHLHPLFRPIKQILVVRKEDRAFTYLIITQKEARALQQQLQKAYGEDRLLDAWLITTSGYLTADHPSPLPIQENEALQLGIIELNLLSGTLSPLYKHNLMTQAEKWIQKSLTRIKSDWLQLRFSVRSLEKHLLHTTSLIAGMGEKQAVMISVAQAQREAKTLFEPAAIKQLTDSAEIFALKRKEVLHLLPPQIPHMNPKHIDALEKEEQIQAVLPKHADRFHQRQIPHITPEQAAHVEAVGCIYRIPLKTIEQMEQIEAPKTFVQALTEKQIAAIANPSWVPHIRAQDLHHLSESMQMNIAEEQLQRLSSTNLERLSDRVLATVPGRIKELSDERIANIHDAAVVPHVARVDLLHPTCAPALQNDQIKRLTNQATIERLPDEKIPYLPVELIYNLPQKRIHAVKNIDGIETLFSKICAEEIRMLSCAQILALYREKGLARDAILYSTNKEWCSLLSAEECNALLDPKLVPYLPKEKTEHLGEKFICITPSQLVELIEASSDLSEKDVANVPMIPELVQKLTPQEMTTLITLRPDALSVYTNPTILKKPLTEEQKKFLSIELIQKAQTAVQLEALLEGQIAYINPNYAHLLSAEKRSCLTSEQIGRIEQKEALQALLDTQLEHINPNCAHLLSTEQRPQLTPQQIEKIEWKEALQALSNKQLEHINPNRAHLLTEQQRMQLSEEQVSAIDHPQALFSIRGKLKKAIRKEFAHLRRYEPSKGGDIALIAFAAIGVSASAFGAILLFAPMGKLPVWAARTHLLIGTEGLLIVTLGSTSLPAASALIERGRLEKERQQQLSLRLRSPNSSHRDVQSS